MPKIKVMVVDDSAFMRRVISDIINSDPDLEVVGKARDGYDAINMVKELNPDVVTMDIEMPRMDGLTALAEIMRNNPLPVIMLSSLTKEGAEQTVKALHNGAVDFIAKPSGQISLDIEKVKDEIIRKIKTVAGTRKKLQNFNNNALLNIRKVIYRPNIEIKEPGVLNKLILIGTSTGGPKALHQVIPRLPGELDAAVLIVQHMPTGFTKSLAERLDSLSQLKVKEAEHGEQVFPGTVYIAPGDYHLGVKTRISCSQKGLYIDLNQQEPRGGHRPSVNAMLESVVQQFWAKIVCVIMTGMGNDGADELVKIKDKGGKIIAEDQSTCIVYGMPKAAVETGQVDRIVPLHEISNEILRML